MHVRAVGPPRSASGVGEKYAACMNGNSRYAAHGLKAASLDKQGGRPTGERSVWLDIPGPNDLSPLLNLLADEFSQLLRTTGFGHHALAGQRAHHLRVEHRVTKLSIEQGDDVFWHSGWTDKAVPIVGEISGAC